MATLALPLPPRQSRVLALALLLLAVLSVLALLLAPFLLLHRHYDLAIEANQEQLERYQRIAAQMPELKKALEAVRAKDGRRFFLHNTAPNLAGAELQDLVRAAIERNAGRITTIQGAQPRDDGRFRQIGINVQLFATTANLQKILFGLETQTPYILIDSVTVRPLECVPRFQACGGRRSGALGDARGVCLYAGRGCEKMSSLPALLPTGRARAWAWWLVPTIVLALLIGWEIDWGRQVVRVPDAPAPVEAKPVVPALLPDYAIEGGLAANSETVNRTLFNATRRPAPVLAGEGGPHAIKPGQFLLAGTAVSGTQNVAFLKEVAGGKSHAVHEGEKINGLLVASVSAERVKFTLGDDSEELVLKVARGPKTTLAAPPPPPVAASGAINARMPAAGSAAAGAAAAAQAGGAVLRSSGDRSRCRPPGTRAAMRGRGGGAGNGARRLPGHAATRAGKVSASYTAMESPPRRRASAPTTRKNNDRTSRQANAQPCPFAAARGLRHQPRWRAGRSAGPCRGCDGYQPRFPSHPHRSLPRPRSTRARASWCGADRRRRCAAAAATAAHRGRGPAGDAQFRGRRYPRRGAQHHRRHHGRVVHDRRQCRRHGHHPHHVGHSTPGVAGDDGDAAAHEWRDDDQGGGRVEDTARRRRGTRQPDAAARGLDPAAAPGFSVLIVPLHYVGARQMATLLEPFVKDQTTVRVDDIRNLLILSGTELELKHLIDAIDMFDINWMTGMSAGVFTLESADVKSVMTELDKAFGTADKSPLTGILRIIPIERMNALLVITPQPEYLEEARKWIERLDKAGNDSTGIRFYVYRVQNGRAERIAPLLQQAFTGHTTQQAQGPTGPRLAPSTPSGTIVSAPSFQSAPPPGSQSSFAAPTRRR